ncbi:MAG: hypothetical protein HY000_07245 [Planctomycetes bacterium]|nr:hypothetical protein [Planctomycetota bacterium]
MASGSYGWSLKLLCAALPLVLGCAPLELRSAAKTPLTQPRLSPGTVVLDIYFIRFPFAEADANGPPWDEIDEQRFPPELRQRLADNGFRVGVVGGHVPDRLAKLMEIQETAAGPPEAAAVTFAAQPKVVVRHLQAGAGAREEIVSHQVETMTPLLVGADCELQGQTFPKGQGVFALRTQPQPDGAVRLELTPEVQYGEPKVDYVVGGAGAAEFRLEAGRPKEVFDSMKLEASLGPGEMLVLTSLPERSASLAHHFFVETANGATEQKLLIIRVAQTQHDPLFGSE